MPYSREDSTVLNRQRIKLTGELNDAVLSTLRESEMPVNCKRLAKAPLSVLGRV